MIAKYSIDPSQINEMDMTISLTMTVKEWLEIMRTKSEAKPYEPFSKVQNMISAALGDLTAAVEKKYSVDHNMNKIKE